MIDNKFLPEDFNLEEWKLFKKYNNRLEKQSRHIDAWFVDEPSLSEEELKKRLAYNKEHLIKDTLDQIAKGLLVEETSEATGAFCGGQCEPAPQPVKQENTEPQVQEQPVAKAEPEVISYKPVEVEQPMPSVVQPMQQQPPEKPKVFEAPQVEQARPPMNMSENEELKLLQDVSSKLDRLIDLAEKIVTQKSKSKRQG